MNRQATIHNPQYQTLERIRAFIASHGNDAWIENDAVHFTSWVGIPTGVSGCFEWQKEIAVVATVAQARAALGY